MIGQMGGCRLQRDGDGTAMPLARRWLGGGTSCRGRGGRGFAVCVLCSPPKLHLIFFRRHHHSSDCSLLIIRTTHQHLLHHHFTSSYTSAMTLLPALLLLLARLSAGHVVLAHANDDLTPIVVVGTCDDANLGLIGSLE